MRRFEGIALVAGLALLSAGPVLAANQGSAPQAPAHMESTEDGNVLVTPAGMTLYLNSAEDTKSEKFRWMCTSRPNLTTNDQQSGVGERPVIGVQYTKSCVQKNPPYLADANAQPVGDFTIVDRPAGSKEYPDGGKQWAYRGYPLYTSIKDHKAGDRNGAPPGGYIGGPRRGGIVMATVPTEMPTGLRFSRRDEGLVIATIANDRPLYTPKGRHSEDEAFQPFLAPAVASIGGDWSIIDAGAGRKQYAYKGKPLYTPPAGMADWEIAEAGGWDIVVVHKAAGRPSDIGKHISLLGDVFTTKDGMTLYNYTCGGGGGFGGGVGCDDAGDAAGYMVALCGLADECAKRWHPYLAPASAKPQGEWSVVEITYPMFSDPHGTIYPPDQPKVKVWAYRGKAVYTYYEDKKPGDIWGNGTHGLWGSGFSAVQVPGYSALFE